MVEDLSSLAPAYTRGFYNCGGSATAPPRDILTPLYYEASVGGGFSDVLEPGKISRTLVIVTDAIPTEGTSPFSPQFTNHNLGGYVCNAPTLGKPNFSEIGELLKNLQIFPIFVVAMDSQDRAAWDQWKAPIPAKMGLTRAEEGAGVTPPAPGNFAAFSFDDEAQVTGLSNSILQMAQKLACNPDLPTPKPTPELTPSPATSTAPPGGGVTTAPQSGSTTQPGDEDEDDAGEKQNRQRMLGAIIGASAGAVLLGVTGAYVWLKRSRTPTPMVTQATGDEHLQQGARVDSVLRESIVAPQDLEARLGYD